MSEIEKAALAWSDGYQKKLDDSSISPLHAGYRSERKQRMKDFCDGARWALERAASIAENEYRGNPTSQDPASRRIRALAEGSDDE